MSKKPSNLMLSPEVLKGLREIAERTDLTYKGKPSMSAVVTLVGTDLIETVIAAIQASTARVPASMMGMPVVRPVNPVINSVVRIWGRDSHVYAVTSKNDIFNVEIRKCGFLWNKDCGAWERAVSPHSPLADCVAELGAKLIDAGFIVQFPSEIIQTKALTADYEVECLCWIDEIDQRFAVRWYSPADYYDRVLQISTARKIETNVIGIDPEHVDSLIDFAEMHRCKFTPAGLVLRDAALNWLSNAMICENKLTKKPVIPQVPDDGIIGVDPDLMDD